MPTNNISLFDQNLCVKLGVDHLVVDEHLVNKSIFVKEGNEENFPHCAFLAHNLGVDHLVQPWHSLQIDPGS